MRRIDLLHPTTLLGAEVRERLSAFPALAGELRLLSNRESEIGTLTEARGAATLVARLEEGPLDSDLVLCCGTIEETRPLLSRLTETSTAILLSAGATVEDGLPVVAGVNLEAATAGRVLVSPPAAAIALARLLHPLRGFGLRRALATAVQPASQRGEEGLHELFEQTRAILTFSAQPPSPILGGQLAYNLVPEPDCGDAITDHTVALLGNDLEVSVHSVLGGVFHGVSLSLHLQLAEDPGAPALKDALRDQEGVELFDPGNRLGPIDAAQSEHLLVGEIRADRRFPGTYRIWATIDNLTAGGAINALRVAQGLSS